MQQMPTGDEYTNRIRELQDTSHLLEFWQSVCERSTPEWEAGRAFEYLIIRAFEVEGARVRYPYEVKGQSGVVEQIDGVLHLPEISALVESKDYQEPLGIEPIAKLRLRLERRPAAAIGVVFAAAGLTEPALEIARLGSPRNILIWQSEEITQALRRKCMVFGLRRKYDYAVEFGMPDYNLLEEWP
jgi:hypothetical protein